MHRNEIFKIAKDSGMEDWTNDGNWNAVDCDLVRFAEAITKKEREACAKVCEGERVFNKPGVDIGIQAAHNMACCDCAELTTKR